MSESNVCYAGLMKWGALKTPAAIVDLDKVERNTARMGQRLQALGVKLRPHVKTHKCVEAARFQVRGHFGGITVSTLAEAKFFARAGFRNVTYAVPVAPAKLSEAADVAAAVDELNLLLDHEGTLEAIEEFARANRVTFSVFLKVDCGYHRAGVDPESERAVKLALRMHESPHVELRGILTHAGHSYGAKSQDELRNVAEQEKGVMVNFARRLESAGVRPRDVSIGSTPTMSVADLLTGITEARPGNYVFYDAFQAAIGSCSLDDAAFTVAVSVIGHYPERNELLVDGGALAFSKDEGAVHVDPACGFGVVAGFPDLRVTSTSQEHGKISGRAPLDFDAHPIGSVLRVIPNHSCLAAALFDRYHVVRKDDVVEEWRPVRGW